MSISTVQTIFLVFFAIFWGTVSNAWPRWKPFSWSVAIRRKRCLHRLYVSLLVLNLLPMLNAGVILWLLDSVRVDQHTLFGWLLIIIYGVTPAFSIFGISRIWVGILEYNPDFFYYKEGDSDLAKYKAEGSHVIEPSQEKLGLHIAKKFGLSDILFGILYVATSHLVAFLAGYFSLN